MSLFCFRCRVSLIFLATVLLVMLKATACTDRYFVWPVFNLLWKLQREMTSWVCAKACSDCMWLKNSYICVCVCGEGEEGERRKRDDWGIYIIMKKERESVTRYNSQGESVNSPIMIRRRKVLLQIRYLHTIYIYHYFCLNRLVNSNFYSCFVISMYFEMLLVILWLTDYFIHWQHIWTTSSVWSEKISCLYWPCIYLLFCVQYVLIPHSCGLVFLFFPAFVIWFRNVLHVQIDLK